jgi:hypothetical protein
VVGRVRFLLALVACGCTTALARAEPPDEQALARAKELFRKGNELRHAGACERALVLFQESRDIVPSVPNILNAAYCKNSLGRYDEALDDYETLLTELKSELSPAEIGAIQGSMAKLGERVGSLNVIANVPGATLVVGGRARGKLPLSSPLRVVVGTTSVVVMREGYTSWTASVVVEPKKLASATAELRPLKIAGRLRIDHPSLVGAELVVDGAPVGKVPWDGVLGPGRHWLSVHKGEQGSAPESVIVVKGQTASITPVLSTLGPSISIRVEPSNAEIVLGEVVVGRGAWQGRLPRGTRRLTLRAEGYFTESRTLSITAATPRVLPVRLEVDRNHPRWGLEQPHFWLEGVMGMPIAPSLGSAAEASCDDTTECSRNGVALGVLVAARVGYELPNRISLHILGGYAHLGKSVERSFDTSYAISPTQNVDARYDLVDPIRLSGPLLAGGISYRLPFGSSLQLRAGLSAGAMLVQSRDDVHGEASTNGETADVSVLDGGARSRSADLFVMPEARIEYRVGAVHVGFGVLTPYFFLQGPDSDHGATVVDRPELCPASAIHCAPFQSLTERERAYGRFFAFVPSLSAGLEL